MRNSQTKLFAHMKNSKTAWGGSTRGKRKVARPFVPKATMHLILRASCARGELSFLRSRHSKIIKALVEIQSEKHFVKVWDLVNVGNHLHLKIKAYSRKQFQAFLISITALIARHLTKARKGKPFGKFWDALAYTRVITTQFEEQGFDNYLFSNRLEANFGKQIRDIFLSTVKFRPA